MLPGLLVLPARSIREGRRQAMGSVSSLPRAKSHGLVQLLNLASSTPLSDLARKYKLLGLFVCGECTQEGYHITVAYVAASFLDDVGLPSSLRTAFDHEACDLDLPVFVFHGPCPCPCCRRSMYRALAASVMFGALYGSRSSILIGLPYALDMSRSTLVIASFIARAARCCS